MSKFTHWIIVDDTSADINYLGRSWFSEVGSWDSVGTYGMPYLGTLHGTSSSASFTFDFEGTGIRVLGSIPQLNSDYWTCSVDGVDLTMVAATGAPRNNIELCFANWLDDKNHTLTVNATPPNNLTFWFDRIDYVPSQNVSLDQKAIGVASGGPGLDSSARTVFVYTFYGVSVSWYGTIFTPTPGNLSWSMDNAGASRISNWIRPSASDVSYPLLNQKFFESPTYPIGMHTLKVSYIANTATTPLGFDYLVVQNGTVPSRSTSESSSPHSTGSTSGTSGPVGRGTIAGGVIGGVLLFGIIVLGFYFCRRRLISKRMEGYSDEPIPFNQPERPAYLSLQTTYPVDRKSQMLSSHPRSIASLPTSNCSPSHIHRTNLVNGPPTSVSSGLNADYFGDHRRGPPSMPSSTQEDVAVDLGQGSNLVPGPPRIVVHEDSGMRFNGETLATPITL